MPLRATGEAVKRLWGRKWIRRVTYLVVGGAATVSLVGWLLEQDFVFRYVMEKVDALVVEETGLHLGIRRVRLVPLLGKATLEDVSFGGDFVTVKSIDLTLDPKSLLGKRPHLYQVRIQEPHVKLSEARLKALRLKPSEKPSGHPEIRLDYLRLKDAWVEIEEPAWGLPAGELRFDATGTGKGVNHLQLELTGSRLHFAGPRHGGEQGRLDLSADLAEDLLVLRHGYIRLAESQFRLQGAYVPKQQGIQAQVKGVADLDQAFRWISRFTAQPIPAPVSGDLDLDLEANGTLAQPRFTAVVKATELTPREKRILPGELELRAKGDLSQVAVSRLLWRSAQGEVEAEGEWNRRTGTQARLWANDVDLDPVVEASRVKELAGLRAGVDVEVSGPGAPAKMLQPGLWTARIQGDLDQGAFDVGDLDVRLAGGRVDLDQLRLDVDTVQVLASGHAVLAPDRRTVVRLAGLEGTGSVRADAAHVSRVLDAWEIGSTDAGGRRQPMDMAGLVSAQARVSLDDRQGLQLRGRAEIMNPRWHGAGADQVAADVSIDRDQLRLDAVHFVRGQGSGFGEMWLTWADLPKGRDQIDMCYQGQGLPVEQGLKAADLDYPLTGTVSGWGRIHGPLDHLLLDGEAQVEAASAYGIQIPAASATLGMDLETLRLKLRDVRVAASPIQLGDAENGPYGDLTLRGDMDLDVPRNTWWVNASGRADSRILGFPGPAFAADYEAHLVGPVTAPFGPWDLPEGRATVRAGRVELGDRVLTGLRAEVSHLHGQVAAEAGWEGRLRPVLEAKGAFRGGVLHADAALKLNPESFDGRTLLPELTDNLLRDARLDLGASADWSEGELAWHAKFNELSGDFKVFDLVQTRPATLQGNLQGALVDLPLEGRSHERLTPAGEPRPGAGLLVSGTLPFSTTAPMQLRAKGDADLQHVKTVLDRVMEVDPYTPMADLRPEGVVRFDLTGHGSLEDPRVDGRAQLDQGRLQFQHYQSVEDLSFNILFKDRSVVIPRETPLLAYWAEGTFQAAGKVDWSLDGMQAYDLEATLENFQVRDVVPGLEVQGSLQATLKGDARSGMLKGAIQAERARYQAEIRLADLILGSAIAQSSTAALNPDDPLDRIGLDLSLSLAQPWTLDTNLLKIEGKPSGDFRIMGTLARPGLKGHMDFQPGGRITNFLPAGDVVLEHGSLDFRNPSEMNPYINLDGTVQVPSYLVSMGIRGTLSNLNFQLSSSPSLRQEEIAAILINPDYAQNAGTTAGTGNTTGALNTGVASAGSGLLFSLVFAELQERLRQTLGLDRVSVAVRSGSTGATETDITVGKTLTFPKFRLPLVASWKKTGQNAASSAIQAEWRFGGITLQFGVGQTGANPLSPTGEIRHTWSPR